MSIKELARRVLPEGAFTSLGRVQKRLKRARLSRLPLLTEEFFGQILVDHLGLAAGDTVFVHSSMDQLNLGFPFYRALALLQQAVGREGTLLFPTYPQLSSYEFLSRGETFDVRRTPSYTGILTEFARRQRGALRSLHPTKSVCATGPGAQELTSAHQLSPYPYDSCSPYYKLTQHRGKIVGLGVSTANLSFVHCVDDALKEDFPVRPYHPALFAAQCINYDGELVRVETYAHDLKKMKHDIPAYMRAHVTAEACRDLKLKGRKFFRADAARLFDEMLRLARAGVTIYPSSVYEKSAKKN
ncbi:MAG TPA: AAC(3) family N-acetyltransferase [Pyrinomonadaceae bacterium]|jgi:aminoglycoside N3'-acetyltransferase